LRCANNKYGYNILPTAGSCLGIKLSEETKAKLRLTSLGNSYSKGRTPHNKGIPMSEASKKHLSKINRGKKHSEESKNKMSIKRKGVPKSKETRDKMGKAKEVRVINLTTNVVFSSVKEASEFYNISRGHIGSVCTGKRNYCGGYKWAYVK
jgi:group I intron endonuclease